MGILSTQKAKKTDKSDRDQQWMENTYKSLKITCENKYPNRTTIIRKTSLEAAQMVPSDLDLVFIDGCHHYESVYQDVMAWLPKVRKNGILCGHDWSSGWRGVRRAVADIIKKYDPFQPPLKDGFMDGMPVPYDNPIINRTSQTVWWGIIK